MTVDETHGAAGTSGAAGAESAAGLPGPEGPPVSAVEPPLVDPAVLGEAGLHLQLTSAGPGGGRVATVTLSRPDRRNAMTPAMWDAFTAIGSALPGDVRVVVVRAEGPSFCAGLDKRMFSGEAVPGSPSLLDLARSSDAEMQEQIARWQRGFAWWRRPDLVSVAAVQGHAVGGGFQLALACDLRIAADDATFCMKEPALGIVPDLGGTKPLVDLVGYPRALEICATSRWVGAAEARQLGLVEAVVPRADLDRATGDLVAALLAAPRGAVTETKALLAGAAGRTHEAQMQAEREAQTRRLRDLTSTGE